VRAVDVVVVGAGPAGAAAATTLGRAGLDAVVIDKARFPRDKICGDGLTAGALRLLEQLGLDPTEVPSWTDAHDVWVRGPSGRLVDFPLPRGQGRFAAIATRRDLDAALVDLARKAGADVLDGHALEAASEDADGVTVQVEGIGPIRARWAVGADGMWSPLRKQLGVSTDGYRGEWHAFRQYVSDVGPLARSDLFISFEPDILPGYFWSFPLSGGRANIGFGIQRGGGLRTKDMTRLWADLLERPHLREVLGDFVVDEPHRAWPIPARVDRTTPTTRRALFVGDAVAACDVLTGEGIGQALASGIRAAEAIVGAGPSGDAASRYTVALRHELVADHRMSALLVKGLSTTAGADRAIALAGANGWTRRNFARWLFEDYPRALIATPRRWRAGAVSRPGAYVEEAAAVGQVSPEPST
jgi:geranylgeranyl reductase family protein